MVVVVGVEVVVMAMVMVVVVVGGVNEFTIPVSTTQTKPT